MCKSEPSVITHDNFNAGFFEASLKAGGNEGNYVASPLSVLVLLSALLNAKGPVNQTATEICEAVVGKKKKATCSNPDYPNIEEMLDNIRTKINSARGEGGKRILTLSNAVFTQRGLTIYPGFPKLFARTQGDHYEPVDFKSSDAFNKINNWADSASDGLIKNYLKDKSELSADTLLMLLNAIAFKDNWAKTFMKEETRQEEFFLQKKRSVTVPMMKMKGQMVYLDKDGYRVVAKPFKNSRFKFVIFLPKKRFDLSEIEDDLEEGDFKWSKVNNMQKYEQIALSLPRFKIEHKIDLKPILNLLGVRRLFTRGMAQLDGISPDAKLFAGDAKQVAVMEVDEAGVKAAAVSGMSIMPMSLPPPATEFKVDQPFYCAIYDSELDMPLFIARVTDPR